VRADNLYSGHDQLLAKLKPDEINEFDRSPCLPTTRLDVIKSVTEWLVDESKDRRQVLWLNGLAGSGKSTLSTTIAHLMRDLRRLGAFFFFDRDIPERNAATVIRTLAYQLALFDTRIGSAMSHIIESHPNIASMPLEFQFTNLLTAQALSSVNWSGGPVVLVIDALDECGTEHDRKPLMRALSKGFSDLPSFIRVVVVSRREPDIEDSLAAHLAVYPYSLNIDTATTKRDILEFLHHRFDEIRRARKHLLLPSDWPGNDKVQILSERAGGLFIWASTACLYMDSHDPQPRLDELITQQPMHASAPFSKLDKLYKTGLESAGNWSDPELKSDYRAIFGTILCARIPLSSSAIDSILMLPRPCLQSVSHLGCVLYWSDVQPIRLLHPSFHDYLSRRSHTEPWFIDIEKHQEMLAVHCIKLLDRDLQENICGLSLPHLVQDETLPEALSYGCRFWVEHVCMILEVTVTSDIGGQIYRFLCKHLLHWMEAMVILNNHDTTIRSLQNLLLWLQVCSSSPQSSTTNVYLPENVARSK
jgi:NACHT domain